MVESTNQGDGQVRNVIYAKWREDKPAEPGYSRELVSVDLDPKYYDDIDSQPTCIPSCLTYLDHFERHIKERGNARFLGQRPKLEDNTFGPYEWKTFKEVEQIAQNVARGIKILKLDA